MAAPTLVYDFTVLENRPFTGVERYALALWQQLPTVLEGWTLKAAFRRDPPIECDASAGWEIVHEPSRLPRLWWRRQVLPDLAVRAGADLLVAPVAHVPVREEYTSCRTVHDIPHGDVLSSEPRSPWQGLLDTRVLQQDIPTIFPSEATRRVFEETTNNSCMSPTTVVYHGIDPVLPPETAIDREPHTILVVGTVRPRRMPQVVARALLLLRREFPDAAVRWLGRHDMAVDGLGEIEFLGALGDDARRDAFGQAGLLLCPSIIEGFGLPALEGLSAGIPVVSADHAAGREMMGDRIVFYDGQSEEALAGAIRAVWTDDSASSSVLAAERRAHAASFTWEESARKHADFFSELIRT